MTSRRTAYLQRLLPGLAVLAAALVPLASHAKTVDPWDGNWHYTVSPYAWLPGISASTRFQVPDATVLNKSSGNIWDNLSGAFELKATARKGRWGIYGDLDWVDFSGMHGRSAVIGRQGSQIDFDSHWDLRGAMVHFAGFYNLAHGRAGYIDLLLGARYVHMQGSLDWNLSAESGRGGLAIAPSGRRGGHADYTNAVIGIRGRWLPFHGRFFVPYHLDFGTGGSTSSAQASTGVGYAFHWGDAALLWRAIRLQQDGSDALLRRATLYGPSIELTWQF